MWVWQIVIWVLFFPANSFWWKFWNGLQHKLFRLSTCKVICVLFCADFVSSMFFLVQSRFSLQILHRPNTLQEQNFASGRRCLCLIMYHVWLSSGYYQLLYNAAAIGISVLYIFPWNTNPLLWANHSPWGCQGKIIKVSVVIVR
jgi:hypothetical protein